MVRYLSFCYSGFVAGTAGTLFVINYELFSPEVLAIERPSTFYQQLTLGVLASFWGQLLVLLLFHYVVSN